MSERFSVLVISHFTKTEISRFESQKLKYLEKKKKIANPHRQSPENDVIQHIFKGFYLILSRNQVIIDNPFFDRNRFLDCKDDELT